MSKLQELRDSFLALLSEDENRTLRAIAERHALRREMDADVDQKGRRWDAHGQEVEVDYELGGEG